MSDTGNMKQTGDAEACIHRTYKNKNKTKINKRKKTFTGL